MKPKCFKCFSTMKLVYIRQKQTLKPIRDYYHCEKCNRTQKIEKEFVPLGNIFVKHAEFSDRKDNTVFSLNLRDHQSELDFDIEEKREEIMKMCRIFILHQSKTEKELKVIIFGLRRTEFNNGFIRITMDPRWL